MEFPESELLQGLPKQFFANLVAKVNAKVATGADVINLGQGNPDKPTPDYIVAATQKWVADPATHKYSSSGDCPLLRRRQPTSTKKSMGLTSTRKRKWPFWGVLRSGWSNYPGR